MDEEEHVRLRGIAEETLCQRQKQNPAEAELHSLCFAASKGIGESASIKIGLDASAGRRGLGRAKRVQMQYLWVQSLVQDGSIVLAKVPSEENRSDMITAHLAAANQNVFLSQPGYVRRTIQFSLKSNVTRENIRRM